MEVFSRVASEADFCRALAPVIHDRVRRTLVEVSFLSTSDMAKIIRDRGPAAYEAQLGQVRQWLDGHRIAEKSASMTIARMEGQLAGATALQKGYQASPPMYRDPVTRRLTINKAAMDRADADAVRFRQLIAQHTETMHNATEQAKAYAVIESRLEAAVMAAMQHREDAVVAAPTPINLSVSVEMPTDPLKMEVVAMPERHTTSEISRDGAGHITASKQTEKDAPHE